MANIFLVDMIKALSEEDRQDALDFLKSGYFNRESNAHEIVALYQMLMSKVASLSEIDLNREQVYQAVFPGKEIIPGKLDKLMSKLKKLLHTYILTRTYLSEGNELQRQLDWATWLRKRDLEDRFELAMTKLKDPKTPETYFDHLRLMQIAEVEHEWENAHNRYNNNLNIPNLIHHLDLYYLNYRIELKNRLLLQQKAAELQSVEIIENPMEHYMRNQPVLKIGHYIHSFLKKDVPLVDEFIALKNLLAEHKRELSFAMMSKFQAYLRNCCILLIDKGFPQYIQTLHEIHKEDLENEHIFMNGKLSANSYANIVQIAIRANQIAWAITFTEAYKNRVHGESEDAFFYRLNMANCLFAEQKFEAALDMIPNETLPSYYHLLTRRLELKAYYELDSDLLMYKMDSFRKYIERTAPKSITANLRTMNLNFVYILNQLSQSLPKDKNRSEKILKRIEEKKIICERNWLIEKAKELGKR